MTPWPLERSWAIFSWGQFFSGPVFLRANFSLGHFLLGPIHLWPILGISPYQHTFELMFTIMIDYKSFLSHLLCSYRSYPVGCSRKFDASLNGCYSTASGFQNRDVCKLVCYLSHPVNMPFTSNSLLYYYTLRQLHLVLLNSYRSYAVDCVRELILC